MRRGLSSAEKTLGKDGRKTFAVKVQGIQTITDRVMHSVERAGESPRMCKMNATAIRQAKDLLVDVHVIAGHAGGDVMRYRKRAERAACLIRNASIAAGASCALTMVGQPQKYTQTEARIDAAWHGYDACRYPSKQRRR